MEPTPFGSLFSYGSPKAEGFCSIVLDNENRPLALGPIPPLSQLKFVTDKKLSVMEERKGGPM